MEGKISTNGLAHLFFGIFSDATLFLILFCGKWYMKDLFISDRMNGF